MSTTAIEWTDRVWNPVTGCTKVSQGCKHCYAETVANRFWATQYPDFARKEHPSNWQVMNGDDRRPRRFTDVLCHPERLQEPLSWRKPSRVFVNSMSDLFHEDVPDDFIARVFDTMALAPKHTFQILTKRPARMLAVVPTLAARHTAQDGSGWPLANVWLGVSTENQETANERIQLLLQTPAAVRFVSAEPLLEEVDISEWLHCPCGDTGWTDDEGWQPEFYGERRSIGAGRIPCGFCNEGGWGRPDTPRASLDWVIVGGESGPGARPCDASWVRSIVQQCAVADIPAFVKQLGARIIDSDGYQNDPARVHLINRKGGDPTEWPEDLRVRQFPREAANQ